MRDRIDGLIRETIIAIGDHRDEVSVVNRFGRRFTVAHRKRILFRRFQWLGISTFGAASWWWPEDWAIGEGTFDLIESLQRLIATPAFIESSISVIDTLLG